MHRARVVPGRSISFVAEDEIIGEVNGMISERSGVVIRGALFLIDKPHNMW